MQIFFYCYALYYQLFCLWDQRNTAKHLVHLSLSHYSQLLPVRFMRARRMRTPQPVVGIATTIKNKGYLVPHICRKESSTWNQLSICLVSASDDACDAGRNCKGPWVYWRSRLSSNLFPCLCTSEYTFTPVNRGFVKLSPSLRTDPRRASKEITPAAASCGSARILENQSLPRVRCFWLCLHLDAVL